MTQCHDEYLPDSAHRASDRRAFGHIPTRARDLMTPDPVTVEPSATVRDIAGLLLDYDVRCVPVVDIGDQLVGVVSEADLVCREGSSSRHHHLSTFVDEIVAEHRHHWADRSEGLTAGEIGCAVSHLRLWQRVAGSDTPR